MVVIPEKKRQGGNVSRELRLLICKYRSVVCKEQNGVFEERDRNGMGREQEETAGKKARFPALESRVKDRIVLSQSSTYTRAPSLNV